MIRTILGTIALAGGVFLLVASAQDPAAWSKSFGESPADSSPRSHVAPHQGEATSIYAAGIVEGRGQTISLDFEIDGRLQSLLVKEGQRVTAGQPLATLDAAAWQTQVEQAQARLSVAHARYRQTEAATRAETQNVAQAEVALQEVVLQQRQRDMDRADALKRRGAFTQQQWDDAYYQLAQAKAALDLAKARLAEVSAAARDSDLAVEDAGVRLAQADLNHARTMLNKNTLLAPLDGVVLDVDAEPGDLVGPARQAPLIRMTDDRQLRVRAHVEELDALALETGQSAWITADGYRDVRWHGTVISCAPLMGPKHVLHHHPGERHDVNVREVLIQLDVADRLIVGLPVDVYIEPVPSDDPSRRQPRRDDAPNIGDALTQKEAP